MKNTNIKGLKMEKKIAELSNDEKLIIERQADVLLKALGYISDESRKNIDVVKSAKSMGFTVGTVKLSKEEQGFIVVDNEKRAKAIGLNELNDGDTNRWVLAHEIGHFLLHSEKGKALYWRENKTGKSEIEQQADWFATCFLMPKGIFKTQYEKLKKNNYADNLIISALALAFRVPFRSVERRIEEIYGNS